jgi:hypothetical protein
VQLTGTGMCLEMNRAGVGRAVNHSPSPGVLFKERSQTSTPSYTSLWPLEIIVHFVPLSSLTVPITFVLFVTICVTATVSL